MSGCSKSVCRAISLIALVSATLANAEECESAASNSTQTTTAVVGAVLGGLLGSAFGSGDGKVLTIGAGAIAGGLLGHHFGASLNCDDQRYHEETAHQSLETKPTGETATWRNPDSGHSGSVTPLRTYQRDDGTYCREFEQLVSVDQQEERTVGTACRTPEATWKIVDG